MIEIENQATGECEELETDEITHLLSGNKLSLEKIKVREWDREGDCIRDREVFNPEIIEWVETALAQLDSLAKIILK